VFHYRFVFTDHMESRLLCARHTKKHIDAHYKNLAAILPYTPTFEEEDAASRYGDLTCQECYDEQLYPDA
jgi:hypothetical protein